MVISPVKIKAFQEKILRFYSRYGRKLPWRTASDPYHILVSEIMLQQTQVDRVTPYYKAWLRQWPTILDLSQASRFDVLKTWSGLGYNKRALNFYLSAKTIVQDFDGDTLAALRHHELLPGIGPYTAKAVEIFSLNADTVTVDTNIRRILLHEFRLKPTTPDKTLWSLAKRCLPVGKSREWHNALMDYGALRLTSKKTGIKPKTRQTRFQGSDRQIRALIVRELLKKGKNRTMSLSELHKLSNTTPARLQKILRDMLKDSILFRKRKSYSLEP